MGGFVVVDGGYSFDERSLMVMDLADTILLVGVLTLPAIRTIQKSLQVFRDLGYGKDKVKLIMNRYGANVDIKADLAQETLQYPIFSLIPNEYQNVVASINQGVPLRELAPSSSIAKTIDGIADSFSKTFYPELTAGSTEEKKSFFRKLFQ